MSGEALQMRLRLARLMREHQVSNSPASIPLSPPADGPMILDGYASTCDLDLERVKMRGWAFVWPLRCERVPLLWKHDLSDVAGTVDELSYDDSGQLKIRATVTHRVARRAGAFSVGARVISYEMRDTDGPNFYATIKSAELLEVSLTDAPANPMAVVWHRYPPSAASAFYPLIAGRVSRLIALAKLMQEART